MKHPLVNPSLTPHGFGVGQTYKRTSWKSDKMGRFNGDWGAARFWEKANRERSAFRPAEHIIHTIMPSMRTMGRTIDGDFVFDGKPYHIYDLAVLTTIAVWLGTNCGQAMFNNSLLSVKVTKTNEYQVRWCEAEKPQSKGYRLKHLLHECTTETCGNVRGFSIHNAYHHKTTEREELLLDAFLFWLGQDSGRDHLAGLEDYIRKTSKAVWEGYRKRNTPELRRKQFLLKQQQST